MRSLFFLSFCVLLSACGGGSDVTSPYDKPIAYPKQPQEALPNHISGTLRPKINVLLDNQRAEEGRLVPYPTSSEVKKMDTILQETNRLRAQKGLAPLELDDNLSAYAEVRAEEAAAKFKHYRLDNTLAIENPHFEGAGASGENLAASNTKGAYDIVHQLWRKSPGHYQNMISPEFERIGLGYYHNPYNGAAYWVQLFAGGDRYSAYHFERGAKILNVNEAIHRAGTHFKNHGASAQKIKLAGQYVLEMQDGRKFGFSKQNYGVISKNQQAKAYVSVGKPFIPDASASFNATYRGKGIGDWRNQRLATDVEARVHFRDDAKVMELKVQAQQQPQLGFTDTLRWTGMSFQGREVGNQAFFYGAQAEEIGGQFSKSVQGSAFRGAYGAKR